MLLPPHPALPALAAALDAAAIADLLRGAGPCRHGWTVERCAVRYLNPGAARAFVYYDVALARGEERRTEWLTGILYGDPAEAAKHRKEIAAAERTRLSLGLPSAFPPAVQLPGLDMVLEAFPFDRRLPGLAPVLAGRSRPAADAITATLGLPAGEPFELETVRYRYGARATLRGTAADRTRAVYVKIFRPEDARDAHRLWAELWRRTQRDRPGFAVARPLALVKPVDAVLLEEARGQPLDDALLAGADPAAAGRTIGRVLAAFHRGAVASLPRRSRQETVRIARKWVELLGWACPDLRRDLAAIASAIEEQVRDVAPAPLHLDFRPEHILLDGPEVTLIDADEVMAGDAVYDAAYFLAAVQGWPRGRPLPGEAVIALAEAFLEAYFDGVPGDWRPRLPGLYACAALRIAVETLRQQPPDWPERIAAVLARAEAALAAPGLSEGRRLVG